MRTAIRAAATLHDWVGTMPLVCFALAVVLSVAYNYGTR